MAEESDEEVDVLGDEENEKETPGSVGSDAVEEVGEVEAVKVEEDLQMLNQPVQPQVEQEQQTTKPAKIEKEKKVETKLEDTPFSFEWCFGRNPNVPVINLSKTNKEFVMLFANGNTAYIHCTGKNCLVPLFAHVDAILYLSTDCSRRFIVSADKMQINIWDMMVKQAADRPAVIHTINAPFHEDGIGTVALSMDAKYLIVASGGAKCVLRLWLWSNGNETADGQLTLPSRFGSIKKLRFNQYRKKSHFFVATFDNGVAFVEWDDEKKKLLPHIPERSFMKVVVDTVYIAGTRKAVSITTTGHVIVWSDTIVEDTYSTVTNEKEYIKTIKLSGGALTAVENFDKVTVIADDCGQIKFYDADFKLLYWCRHLDLGVPITSICPNAVERRYKILKSLNESELELTDDDIQHKDIIYEPLMPRDFTIDENPLIVRDFLITTAGGRIIAINFIDSSLAEVFYRCDDIVTAMDVHPIKELLCVAIKGGRVVQYDTKRKLQTNEILIDLPITEVPMQQHHHHHRHHHHQHRSTEIRPDSRASRISRTHFSPIANDQQTVVVRHEINLLKFSARGEHLTIATENGMVYGLDPVILAPFATEPFKFNSDLVTHLSYSDDGRFMAMADVTGRIFLLYHCNRRWLLIGKNRCHHKPVTDLIFVKNIGTEYARLFSIGEDRMLVEFDIEMSVSNGRLEAANMFWYDQVPAKAVRVLPQDILAMFGLSSAVYESALMVCDDKMKIKVVDYNSGTILFTFLGPMFGGQMRHLNLFKRGTSDLCIFSVDNKLGALYLPFDGNPFRSIGVTACCSKLKNVAVSKDGYVFCHGENDYGVTMWKINESVSQTHYQSGGTGLAPFCYLLPGGKNGWLFQELLDMFYYLQILAVDGESKAGSKNIEFMNVSEIADFMRSVNFFPTDFEIKNMMREMELFHKEHITFAELVKMYVNHKPVHGTRSTELERALDLFIRRFRGRNSKRSSMSSNQSTTIDRSDLMRILTEFGEKIDPKQAIMCLKEFFNVTPEEDDDENEVLAKIPHKIDIEEFVDNLLGLGVADTVAVTSRDNVSPTTTVSREDSKGSP